MAGRFPATWPINYSAGAREVSGQLASEPVSGEGNRETEVKERMGDWWRVGWILTAPHAHVLADSLGEALMGTVHLNSDNIFTQLQSCQLGTLDRK